MPAITREALEERKQALLSDLSAVSGALTDVDYWLAFLGEGEDETSPSEQKGDE
jgi:hypothetical protein